MSDRGVIVLSAIEAKPDQKIVYNFPSFAYAPAPNSVAQIPLALTDNVSKKLHESMNGYVEIVENNYAKEVVIVLSTIGSAYYGYSRNKSASSAIAWGIAGYVIPRSILYAVRKS
jgi:hypothetical protein